MSDLFDGILKPGQGGELALRRELERRRDAWDRTDYLYRGAGDYLLKHGRFYQGRDTPDMYNHLIGGASMCFRTAGSAALAEPSLRYVEGVYTTGHSAFTPHAWCIDPDDQVVELTFPTRDRERYVSQVGMPIPHPERWSYWGVIFRPELLEAHIALTGELCMFDRPATDEEFMRMHPEANLDMSQEHDWPILKVPYDPDRVTL